ncbi:MAG: DUF4406 domain-containing protein [Candidatus Cloacimonadota bacterium]|nr:DUF4406 domain-containing protein [Candidatus Cloacimonadota bacterium]
MKRVYVAGAYSGTDVLTVLKNIGRGEWYAAEMFAKGLYPFVPWYDKDFAIKLWDRDLTVQQFYDYSIAWLDVSEAMFLVPGWKDSKGTIAEIERAKKLGIPVFEDLDALYGWALKI